LIGPDKAIKEILAYPMSNGRNFDEILRLLEFCQLTAEHQVALGSKAVLPSSIETISPARIVTEDATVSASSMVWILPFSRTSS